MILPMTQDSHGSGIFHLSRFYLRPNLLKPVNFPIIPFVLIDLIGETKVLGSYTMGGLGPPP